MVSAQLRMTPNAMKVATTWMTVSIIATWAIGPGAAETHLLPNGCSCVYNCSSVNTTFITWSYLTTDNKRMEVTYDGSSYVNEAKTDRCLEFNLTEHELTQFPQHPVYNMISTLMIAPACTDEFRNASLRLRCSSTNDDSEAPLCIPDVIQLPIPTNVTLWESTPSSVLISVETPAEYETCITNYSVTVNNFECPTLDLVNNSKYTLICSDLDLYAAHYEFNVSARSLWFDQSDGFIKPFVAVGTSLDQASNLTIATGNGSILELSWNAPSNKHPKSPLFYDVSIFFNGTHTSGICANRPNVTLPLREELKPCTTLDVKIIPYTNITKYIERSALRKTILYQMNGCECSLKLRNVMVKLSYNFQIMVTVKWNLITAKEKGIASSHTYVRQTMDDSFYAKCKLANTEKMSHKVMNGGKCYFNYADIVIGDPNIAVYIHNQYSSICNEQTVTVHNIFDIGELSPSTNRVRVSFKLSEDCCTKSFKDQLKYKVQYSWSPSEYHIIRSEIPSIELQGLLSGTDYHVIASITTSNGTRIGWPLERTFHTEDEDQGSRDYKPFWAFIVLVVCNILLGFIPFPQLYKTYGKCVPRHLRATFFVPGLLVYIVLFYPVGISVLVYHHYKEKYCDFLKSLCQRLGKGMTFKVEKNKENTSRQTA